MVAESGYLSDFSDGIFSKSPPTLREDISYDQWKKEIQLWKTFTDLAVEKQAPAICFALSGKARETALELDN